MSEHEHENPSDEEIAEEIDRARDDEAGADEQPQPWAKAGGGSVEGPSSDS